MENPITIKFELTSSIGEHYAAESTINVFYDLESELDVIGQQLNAFLRQAGYTRPHDCIMMESITDEEYADLLQYLDELRSKNKEE